jgi:hypothetical protein
MREEFRRRIVAEADGVADLYLYGRKIGQPATREQKEFIEGIVATDYDGRTVIELLQNGHDAHPADRTDGQLEFLPSEDEGTRGGALRRQRRSPGQPRGLHRDVPRRDVEQAAGRGHRQQGR